MPQDILRGTDPIRKIHAFLFLYSEIKQTENLYEKFRQFLKEKSNDDPQMNSDKKWDRLTISQEAVIADILNPKTGANATVYQVYNLTFSEENMSKEIIDVRCSSDLDIFLKLIYLTRFSCCWTNILAKISSNPRNKFTSIYTM